MNCQRFNCFPCNTGNEGVCRKTGAGYQIDCNVCGEESITNKYAGETGKNLFNRGANHVNDVEKKRTKNTIVETHIGKTQRSDGNSNILPLPNEADSILFQATEKESK